MKAPSARVAMLLSIGGVLAAGSAAALVNSQVLDDQSGGAPASATAVSTSSAPAITTVATTASATVTQAATAETVPTTAVATTATLATTVPPTTATTSTPTTAPPATAAARTQATYRLGNAGTALLDTAGGRLTVVSVTPAPGWVVERAESDGPAAVEIRLESESGEVRFEASLVRGVVRVSLDTGYDNSGSGSGDDDDSSGSGSGGDDDSSGSGSGGGGSDSGKGSGDD